MVSAMVPGRRLLLPSSLCIALPCVAVHVFLELLEVFVCGVEAESHAFFFRRRSERLAAKLVA